MAAEAKKMIETYNQRMATYSQRVGKKLVPYISGLLAELIMKIQTDDRETGWVAISDEVGINYSIDRHGISVWGGGINQEKIAITDFVNRVIYGGGCANISAAEDLITEIEDLSKKYGINLDGKLARKLLKKKQVKKF
jgi:hypothetical protein